MTEFTFKAEDGTELHGCKWEVSSPRAVVHLVHGSIEHIRRYTELAEFLNKNEYSVYGFDLRGHGKTADSSGEFNVFSNKKGGWNACISDLKVFNSYIQAENPDVKVYMMGHSMGSFLIRHYISLYGDSISGALLSGSGGGRRFLLYVAGFFSRLIGFFKGMKHKGLFLHKLTYGAMNSEIPNARTDYDFLSRDANQVQMYIDDPWSGGITSCEYIREMMYGFLQVTDKKAFLNTPNDLPLYFFSGEKDPIAGPKGDAGELKQAVKNYEAAGIKNIKLKIYPDARHEILNETNRQQVFSDVLAVLDAGFC